MDGEKDDMAGPLFLAARRERLSEKIRWCPACRSDQLQLVQWIVATADFKCRMCGTKFFLRLKAGE